MALETAAFPPAVMVTLCAIPGVNVIAVGCAVTPAGRPDMVTVTISVKPFMGTAFRLSCCPALPGTTVTLDGVTARVKSRVSVGLDPPLQDIRTKQKGIVKRKPESFGIKLIGKSLQAAGRILFIASKYTKLTTYSLRGS
jgi:hypothetical protein